MNKIKLLLALMALALPGMAKAQAQSIPTYVAISTWTLGGTGTKAFAFQNKSTTRSLAIHQVEILPASGGTVTSGPVNFWVLASTVMTHGGTSQVSAYSNEVPNWSAPSFLYASTGPVNVTYEGKDTRQLPIGIIPANPDETADPRISGITDFSHQIILPANANRGIVIEQKQYGATDWTAGVVMVRITYSFVR